MRKTHAESMGPMYWDSNNKAGFHGVGPAFRKCFAASAPSGVVALPKRRTSCGLSSHDKCENILGEYLSVFPARFIAQLYIVGLPKSFFSNAVHPRSLVLQEANHLT